MPKTTAQLVPFCLALAISLLPQTVLAFDGQTDDGGGSGGRPDQQMQETADYGDIMDDVEAVIDAMDEAMGNSGSTAEAFRAPTPESSHKASRTSQPKIAQGPRTPSPIVVELFTAEGCDVCPPAQEMLGNLQGRPDVLVLSWHVDYWDYLGWTDGFARPEFIERQKGYNRSRGARTLFTPQMIVAGETALDNPNPAALTAAIKHERAEGDHVAITRRGDAMRSEIELSPLTTLPGEIMVQLIRYIPNRTVDVTAGENDGKQLSMYNIVVGNEVLAHWDGKAPLRMTVTLGVGRAGSFPADTRHALIVQQLHHRSPGEIFATVLLD